MAFFFFTINTIFGGQNFSYLDKSQRLSIDFDWNPESEITGIEWKECLNRESQFLILNSSPRATPYQLCCSEQFT